MQREPRLPAVLRAPRATNVTISMWTHDILYVKFFTARAREWEKQYPQYHFTYNFVQIPNGLARKAQEL